MLNAIHMLIVWNQVCTFGFCERTMQLEATYPTNTQCMMRKSEREGETGKRYDCVETRGFSYKIAD